MESLALDVGRALRRIRKDRGLTLRQVAATSGGAFKATSIAGYERGERAITLERFVLLCRLYDVEPEQLLASARRREPAEERPMSFDEASLRHLSTQERELLLALVRQVRERRGSLPPGRIMVRADDLAVLATASGADPDELKEALGGRSGASRTDRDDGS